VIKTAALLPADLNRLTRETDMLLANIDSLTDEAFAAPSKCEGWTRAHVVAHLALGADATGNMITWGTTGVETPPYVSGMPATLTSRNLAKTSARRDQGCSAHDMDALEDALEIVVERVSANEDFPGVTFDTDEGEHYVIGDGATAIKGGRDAVIGIAEARTARLPAGARVAAGRPRSSTPTPRTKSTPPVERVRWAPKPPGREPDSASTGARRSLLK
jgi:maleylpyruvate isomerase